jgi:hypothetical protein
LQENKAKKGGVDQKEKTAITVRLSGITEN